MSTENGQHLSPEFLQEDRGPGLVATGVVLIVFETLIFSTRLFCKFSTKTQWGRDDAYIALGFLFSIALNILCAVMVPLAGVGTHIAKNLMIDPYRLTHELKGLIAIEWLYGIACFFPKMAILQLYVRLFHPKIFRRLCFGCMALVAASVVQITIVATFQCTPVAFAWDKSIDGHCIDTEAFYRWTSFPNICTDIAILCLPIPLILKLQINLRKKLEVLALFILGGAGLITSIIRFALFFTIDAFSDVTWASGTLLVITCIEPGIYFICACLPGVQHLFRDLRDRLSRVSNKVTATSHTSRRQGFRRMEHGAGGKREDVPLESIAGDRQWMGRGNY